MTHRSDKRTSKRRMASNGEEEVPMKMSLGYEYQAKFLVTRTWDLSRLIERAGKVVCSILK